MSGCGLFPATVTKDEDTDDEDTDTADVDETYGMETKIPKVMKNKKNALQLAAVAEEYARQITHDGTLAEPVLTSTADVGMRFQKLNEYAWSGKNTLATPKFKTLTGKLMQDELQGGGTSPVELTKELRDKAAGLFKAIAYGLRKVK